MSSTLHYNLDTDKALGGDNASDYIVASQSAIKYYIDHSSGGMIVDNALSTTSENPVQNKVITLALNGKQSTLVSGINIKTINGNSILGNGNIEIDSLPSQTGQAGKFLTTNGTDASWAETTKITIRDWSAT